MKNWNIVWRYFIGISLVCGVLNSIVNSIVKIDLFRILCRTLKKLFMDFNHSFMYISDYEGFSKIFVSISVMHQLLRICKGTLTHIKFSINIQ